MKFLIESVIPWVIFIAFLVTLVVVSSRAFLPEELLLPAYLS